MIQFCFLIFMIEKSIHEFLLSTAPLRRKITQKNAIFLAIISRLTVVNRG